MGLGPGSSGTEIPPRPFTTDHCQSSFCLPGATSKMSSLPPSAETINDPFPVSGENILHQTTPLLKKGMSTVMVAFPDQSVVVVTNCSPDAFGSIEAARGEISEANSASKGK